MAAVRNPSLAFDYVAVTHIRTAGSWHVKFGREILCSKILYVTVRFVCGKVFLTLKLQTSEQ